MAILGRERQWLYVTEVTDSCLEREEEFGYADRTSLRWSGLTSAREGVGALLTRG